jgi:hypothetical protein
MNTSRSKQEATLVFILLRWSSDKLFFLPYSTQLSWKYIGEIVLIKISSKYNLILNGLNGLNYTPTDFNEQAKTNSKAKEKFYYFSGALK